MADRFDKFTERARKVLQLAQEEAQRFNHNYIGTEHLLLGLVREGEGIAAGVLESLGVSLDKVRSQVIYVLNQSQSYGQQGEAPSSGKQQSGGFQQSPAATAVTQSLSEVPELLTAREKRIAVMIREGLDDAQIAGTLSMSERAVRENVRRIADKLGFAPRAQIARWARMHEPRVDEEV